ncbi:DUF1266 domain-containing protein [Metabacillus indicus]|uniref:DUF1266 domain-containing protein n=1 Tax=Metabacillus indicus TaxID=246786 RepID=UPI003CFB098A
MNRKQKKYINTLAPLCMTGYYSYYYSLYLSKLPFTKHKANKHLKYLEITDSQTAHAKVEWLLTKGNRWEFYCLKSIFLFDTENESNDPLSANEDERFTAKLSAVKKYMYRLNEHSIGAFDISSVLWITMHAQKTGLITKEEAQAFELRAVRLAQSMYINWRDYLASCTAGTEYLQKSTSNQEKYLTYHKNTLIKFMASKHSPFRKIDFKTSFS